MFACLTWDYTRVQGRLLDTHLKKWTLIQLQGSRCNRIFFDGSYSLFCHEGLEKKSIEFIRKIRFPGKDERLSDSNRICHMIVTTAGQYGKFSIHQVLQAF